MTIPVIYKITDYNEEVIQDSFFEEELQKSSQKTFRIGKILRRKGDKSLIKWVGYSDAFNSWIDTKTIEKLTTDKSFDTVEEKTNIKTCFDNYNKTSINNY